MKQSVARKIVYWPPRILGIIFVVLLSSFALDVFGQFSGWSVVLALFMHLLPALVLLAAVIIAWKEDLVGIVAFLAFAVYYVFQVGFGQHWSWYVLIPGPAVIISLLFFVSWLQKDLENNKE